MDEHVRIPVDSFPTARLASGTGGPPIEVCLIAQLGHGAGSAMIAQAQSRQRRHAEFKDALDEPSARLGGIHASLGDFTSLYSFAVGRQGHPFHRHAGHRVFTAVSGSAGALLRFASVSDADMHRDPDSFLQALRHVEIPPDCLFSVRFPGETWHQFLPLGGRSLHPAFFALSCHTNELGGQLSADLKAVVADNLADIASLSELLPEAVQTVLRSATLQYLQVPTTRLALEPAGSLLGRFCAAARCSIGLLRGMLAGWSNPKGVLSSTAGRPAVTELPTPPDDSLLLEQLVDAPHHHQDTFRIMLNQRTVSPGDAPDMLDRLLEGFLENRPAAVSHLMKLRNTLVKPLGLRTSPLGCPVSSLLAPDAPCRFAKRHPVLAERVSQDGLRAEVVLGADDRHLVFRSCVGVRIVPGHSVEVTLGTRVRCRNRFGHVYLRAIDHVHRAFVTPAMLRMAVEYAWPGEASVDINRPNTESPDDSERMSRAHRRAP